MNSGGLLQSGLTISVLAEQLGMPEYRLRQTINRQLGFRNFSSFLNHHRIDEAKKRLIDPSMSRLPILTIAMAIEVVTIELIDRLKELMLAHHWVQIPHIPPK